MNKYTGKDGYIYIGNICEMQDGNKIVLKEKEYLVYYEKTDSFYIFSEVFGYIYDLTMNKDKKSKEIINSSLLPHKEKGKDGEVFVEESSITISKQDIKYDKKGKRV